MKLFENVESAREGMMASGWITYAGVIGLSIWGGLTSFFEKKDKFSWMNLLAHLLSASFAGFMAFMGCDYAGITGPLTGVIIGVSSHMGTPALIKLAMKLKPVSNLFSTQDKNENVS